MKKFRYKSPLVLYISALLKLSLCLDKDLVLVSTSTRDLLNVVWLVSKITKYLLALCWLRND